MSRVSSLVAAAGLLFVIVGCNGPYSASNVCETQARA